MTRFIGKAGDDTYRTAAFSASNGIVVERPRHRERQNAPIGKNDDVGGVAREFATPTATSAVRGKRGGQGARFDDACQLCSVHGLARSQVRTAQPAVASMAGLRICAHHRAIVRAIAQDDQRRVG
jgi:hypothetical protein